MLHWAMMRLSLKKARAIKNESENFALLINNVLIKRAGEAKGLQITQ